MAMPTENHLPALTATAEAFLGHKYEYIIVGGGTAGLVVAARLTENPDVTVGVLEVGQNHLGDPLIDIPVSKISGEFIRWNLS
ncbi:hypothetical protein M433DRAFT_168745 [Acidomyces richmondensis BFW]|nr:MAG: hypothetical protein FE78DRAFT_103083 [Acidomyces sp. 'richmondensis']KYG42420.1 hypothetical protein M433DRAFT_168745 [Acidomyces richmondensis BFW]